MAYNGFEHVNMDDLGIPLCGLVVQRQAAGVSLYPDGQGECGLDGGKKKEHPGAGSAGSAGSAGWGVCF